MGCAPSRQRFRLVSVTVRLCGLFVTLICAAIVRAEAAGDLTAEIPAQPLAAALSAYAQQTGLQLIYVSELARGKSSKGAAAGLTPKRAIAQLLEGTGLQFEFLNQRSVRIFAAGDSAVRHSASSPGASTTSPFGGAIVLEEVVVTANKREESLSTVPMSVSVLSSEDLQASGITRIDGIAARTPGMEFDFSSQFGAGTLTNIALRGINSNTGQSTTALYIDDVPIHAWHVDTAFGNPYPVAFDLARVEVLRGPQGTLFGTGAEGGAIRFITNAPSTKKVDGLFQAEVSTTEHGDPSFQVGAAAGGPLIDGKLGARASAWYRSEGGFVDRVDPFTLATVDENANRNSLASFRVALAFLPEEAVRVLPSYTHQSLDIHDSPSMYLYLSSPGTGVRLNGKLLRQPAEDRFSLGTLKVEADIGATTLVSVTSYLDRTSSAAVDQTNQAGVAYFGGFGNPLGPAYPSSYADAVENDLGAQQYLFSQEVRLLKRDSLAPLTWVAGLFYGRSHLNTSKDTYMVTAPEPPGLYGLETTVDSDVAVFGDATLSPSRRWRFNLGARLEQTKTDYTVTETGYANPDSVPYYRNAADTGTSLAPRLAVSYVPNDGALLYTSAAKGFRAGGLNVPQCGAPSRYAPDSVWSYEAGAKESLFGQRLRLASSIYFARWSDIQQRTSTITSCFVDYTSNLGAAVSRGFELAAEGLLSEHIFLGIEVGYLDAHYTKTIKAGGNVIVEEGTAVGGLPAVPSPWSLVLRAEYRLPVGAGTVAYAGAEEIAHSHNPGPFLEANPESPSYNPTQFADPATKLLNLHFGLTRESLDLKVSVLNVLNSQPLLQHDSDAPGSSLQYAYTFRPRMLTLSGTRRF